jgi:hypothetical protein
MQLELASPMSSLSLWQHLRHLESLYHLAFMPAQHACKYAPVYF